VPDPAVILGGEDEADPRLVETATADFGLRIELDAEPLQHVGRAAAGGDRAVAGLRHRDAELRGHERHGGGDVDRAGAVAARAAAVGVAIVGARKRQRGREQRLDRSGHHLGGLAPDLERGEDRGHFHVGVLPVDEATEGRGALLPRERAAAERLEDFTRPHRRPSG